MTGRRRCVRGSGRPARPPRAGRTALATLLAGAVLAAVGGCGQRGPLVLPEEAATGGAATGAGAAAGNAAPRDDEGNERERDER